MKINKILNTIIAIIGLLIILVIFFSNVLFTANISNSADEIVNITRNDLFTLIIAIPVAIGLYTIGKKISKIEIKNKKIRISIYIAIIVIYLLSQIFWIRYRNECIVGDQLVTYNLASSMYNKTDDTYLKSQYFELYPQQLTLDVAWNLIFNIVKTDNLRVIQILNVIANIISLIAIFLITKLLGKQYKINKLMSSFIYLGFLSIPLLSTFIYGDETGLAMALMSIYFIMKYGMTDKKRYLIYSAIFMAISYILRMNNLIIILAIIIYLVLNILKKKTNLKDVSIKTTLIIIFILISMMPASIIKNVMQDKYELNKNNKFPAIGYICMGMNDSTRQAGWYNTYGDIAWDDIDNSKEEYTKAIKDRIIYFKDNPIKMIRFYARKTISMWTENTYASIWYNQTLDGEATIDEAIKDEKIISVHDKLSLYQKGLMLVIFGISIIVIIQNRKNISNELILLLTVFIGGFLFHLLWEAKSRYIIGYIVVLIPITSIALNKIKSNKKIKKEDSVIEENHTK